MSTLGDRSEEGVSILCRRVRLRAGAVLARREIGRRGVVLRHALSLHCINRRCAMGIPLRSAGRDKSLVRVVSLFRRVRNGVCNRDGPSKVMRTMGVHVAKCNGLRGRSGRRGRDVSGTTRSVAIEAGGRMA